MCLQVQLYVLPQIHLLKTKLLPVASKINNQYISKSVNVLDSCYMLELGALHFCNCLHRGGQVTCTQTRFNRAQQRLADLQRLQKCPLKLAQRVSSFGNVVTFRKLLSTMRCLFWVYRHNLNCPGADTKM